MKKMKKLVSILLTLVMVIAMAAPAFAANITIDDGDVEGAQYVAYKLLNAENTTVYGEGGVEEQLYVYTVNDSYRQILKSITGAETDREIIEYIEALNDADGIRKFADSVYGILDNLHFPADITAVGNEFTGVDQGYYLIVETTPGVAPDSYSLVMLDTAGNDNLSVTTKEDSPTLEKQIQHNDNDDGTWGLVGDNQIGDTVNFRIITKVPKNTDVYDSYTYVIHDTMSVGLTSNVLNGNSNRNVEIKVGENGEVLDSKYYTVTVEEGTPNTFTISVDIKAAIEGEALTGDGTEKLYVTYTGVVNENALIYDSGKQDNEAYLEYSNNPYKSEEKSETPHKKVYDWTFKMEVNKVETVDGESKTIDGAEFALSKDGDLLDTNGNINIEYEAIKSKLIPLYEVIEGVEYRVATSEEIEKNDGKIVYVIKAGKPTIKGLDDDTDYYLYETKAPDGYNGLKTPVKFKISAEYSEDGSGVSANNPTVVVDSAEPSKNLTTDVENKKGSILPSTGGIGTTIFYIVGAVLVIGAGILLVTKKKMSHEE